MSNSSRFPNPWPIVITSFFIVFFSGLVVFVVFASTQRVDLVRTDYYEQEIRHQQQMERVQRTQQLGQPVAVNYDPVRQSISITLPAIAAADASGHIHLYRPSDARLDQQVELALNAQGTQRLDASKLRAGLWKVRVQWMAGGQEYYFDQSVVVLASNRSSA